MTISLASSTKAKLLLSKLLTRVKVPCRRRRQLNLCDDDAPGEQLYAQHAMQHSAQPAYRSYVSIAAAAAAAAAQMNAPNRRRRNIATFWPTAADLISLSDDKYRRVSAPFKRKLFHATNCAVAKLPAFYTAAKVYKSILVIELLLILTYALRLERGPICTRS